MTKFKTQLQSLSDALLNKDNELLVWAEKFDNENFLAHAALTLVKAAQALEPVFELVDQKSDFDMKVEAASILSSDLEEIAKWANELDSSEDPALRKRAEVLDQILVNFAQSNLKAFAESEEDAEIAKLRTEYRAKALEKSYKAPKQAIDKDNGAAEMAKQIKEQVKEYRPMEASLSTRYCPDHPGAQIRRIGDAVYQCALDKQIYNWADGFTTEKGNIVPGGNVSNQSQALADRQLEAPHFSNREERLQKG